MLRFIVASIIASVVGWLSAAPVPSEPDAKSLVAKLSDSSEKVRNEANAALKDRPDALPWLRRAARSKDPITAQRATNLLAPHEKTRQEAVAKAIDACVRDGSIDLLTEWHQYWKPAKEEDLWAVGPRAAKAGLDLYAKSCPKDAWELFEKELARTANMKTNAHDGPYPERFEMVKCAWLIRTDRLDGRAHASETISFASVAGPARLSRSGGRYLVLGPVEASTIAGTFVACDGGIDSPPGRRPLANLSVVVCRGNYVGGSVLRSVLLVDGDVDLTRASDIGDCLIRATGEIRLPKGGIPKAERPVESKIEPNTKDATAPYKFFELADVGLSVAGKDGLVVTSVKADTPFGNCGLAKGDLIRAIDDVPAGNSEQFRKAVRRALVRQGDCLITVTRGDKSHDLPVFFPLPK